MRDPGQRTAWAFFFGVPLATACLLLTSLLYQEPYPTLLMPSFSRASIDEAEAFSRSYFLVGSSTDDAVEITPLQFVEIDFTQSQADPIVGRILERLPEAEGDLAPWVLERIAKVVPSMCGSPVELRRERVRLDRQSQTLITVEVEAIEPLGSVPCS